MLGDEAATTSPSRVGRTDPSLRLRGWRRAFAVVVVLAAGRAGLERDRSVDQTVIAVQVRAIANGVHSRPCW